MQNNYFNSFAGYCSEYPVPDGVSGYLIPSHEFHYNTTTGERQIHINTKFHFGCILGRTTVGVYTGPQYAVCERNLTWIVYPLGDNTIPHCDSGKIITG